MARRFSGGNSAFPFKTAAEVPGSRWFRRERMHQPSVPSRATLPPCTNGVISFQRSMRRYSMTAGVSEAEIV
jgi:hypothetical protein